MRTALVVTVGSKHESLGASKLAAWLRRSGWSVDEATTVGMFDAGKDLYAFSVVFSWKLPELVQMVRQAKQWGEVWIGGPAVTFHHENRQYVVEQTGVQPQAGLDPRFEEEPTDSPMVYFSRGCPAYTSACGYCPVPRIEGTRFRFYPNAKPARLLLDNNLSALPDDYQEHIIQRYAADWRGRSVDCNSGFEPHSFTEKTFERWSRFPLACWRFGYDDLSERPQAIEMMRLLRSNGLSGDKIRVYTLIGNEPKGACHQRVREVIEHGFHPVPQRLRPLNWRSGSLPTQHDWDEPTLIAFQRFYSLAALWGKLKPSEFYYQSRYPLLGI